MTIRIFEEPNGNRRIVTDRKKRSEESKSLDKHNVEICKEGEWAYFIAKALAEKQDEGLRKRQSR
jgi:hypothetical protein